MKIKMNRTVFDGVSKKALMKGAITDLGVERNENAVKKGLAVWVDSRSLKVEKPLEGLKATEKKEGTPKKTTSSVKGKKIETK